MADITFEIGIAIPASSKGALKDPYAIAGRDCPVGGSFIALPKKISAISSQVRRRGLKLVTRKQDDGTMRVWVVAERPARQVNIKAA